MIVLIACLIIGLLLGRRYLTNLLILASIVVPCACIYAELMRGTASVVDILLLFSYLSALQGGFLIGAYIQTNRTEKKQSSVKQEPAFNVASQAEQRR
jgi:uncharacterized protein YneF (UPF0154 family)